MVEDIGKRIKQRRMELDMTQEALAQKSKVCRITISYLESGRTKNVLASTLSAIAEALETTVDFFLT